MLRPESRNTIAEELEGREPDATAHISTTV